MASQSPGKHANLVDAAHANTEVAFKHLANQPTVGLFYVSQHVRSSLPGLADNCRTLQSLSKNAKHVTIDAAELTECSTTLSTHLSPLCTTLLEQVRQATSIVAELNQSAESPAAGAKTWTSWLPRSTGASSS